MVNCCDLAIIGTFPKPNVTTKLECYALPIYTLLSWTKIVKIVRLFGVSLQVFGTIAIVESLLKN